MATDKSFGLLSPEKDPDQVLIADALTTVGPSASVTLPVGKKGVQVAVREVGEDVSGVTASWTEASATAGHVHLISFLPGEA